MHVTFGSGQFGFEGPPPAAPHAARLFVHAPLEHIKAAEVEGHIAPWLVAQVCAHLKLGQSCWVDGQGGTGGQEVALV